MSPSTALRTTEIPVSLLLPRPVMMSTSGTASSDESCICCWRSHASVRATASAGVGKRSGQIQRRLPAKLHNQPLGLHAIADIQNVFRRKRLEEEIIARVVIRRDRLGVGIHHDGLVASVFQGEGCLTAAVVKLDALPNTIGAAAEDHDAVFS